MIRSLKSLVQRASDALHLAALKHNCLDVIDGVSVCDLSLATNVNKKSCSGFLNLTREALVLIHKVDSRRYSRVRENVRYIVNTELISGGNFVKRYKVCNVDVANNWTSPDPVWNVRQFACTLIHEATHGLISEKGIAYDKSNRERIERLCHCEEARFLRHFEPEYAANHHRPFDLDYYARYWDESSKWRLQEFVKRIFWTRVRSDRRTNTY